MHSILILLLSLVIVTFSQFATLSYPSSINSGRIVCSSHAAGATTTYTPTFSPYVFGANPILAVGISQMSITPTLTIDFKCVTSAISTTGFTLTITLGAATSTFIPLISFHYLGIHQTAYNSGVNSPLYTNEIEWSGTTLAAIGLNNGQRSLQLKFDRTFVAPLLTNDLNHNLMCSPMLMGITGTTTDYEYFLQSTCYCTFSSTCLFQIGVKQNTRITTLRVRFFMVDVLMIEMVHMVAVAFWNQFFVAGAAVSPIPTTYSSVNTAIFAGLHSLTISGTSSNIFDIDYTSGVFSVPTSYTTGFHYYFISLASCHSGSVGYSGNHQCFNGYNGCPFTTSETFSVNRGLYGASQQRISPTNKYIIYCYSDGLDIFRHSGTAYVLHQSINKRWGCRYMSYSKDFSIIATSRVPSSTYTGKQIVEVHVYNSTSQQWDFKHGIDADSSTNSNSIAISENGQTIMLGLLLTASPNVGQLQQFQFNTTSQKYEMVNIEKVPGTIVKMSIQTDPVTGQMRLIMVTTDGFRIVQRKKFYKSGKFVTFSSQSLVLNTMPNYLAQRTAWSFDTKVLALQGEPQFGFITIYHFNQTTQLYEEHSRVLSFGMTPSISLYMDQSGLNMAAYGKDGQGFFMTLYKRNSLVDEFTVIGMERIYGSAVQTSLFDLSKEVIVVSDIPATGALGSMKVYYCGASVIGSAQPQDGYTIMSTIITEAQILPTDLQIQSLTNSTLQIQSNLSLITNQTQNLSTKAVALEAMINSTSLSLSGSTQQAQQLSSELDNTHKSINEQKQKDNALFAVLFTLIGLQTIALVVLAYFIFKKLSQQNGRQRIENDRQNTTIEGKIDGSMVLRQTQNQLNYTKSHLNITNTETTINQRPDSNSLSMVSFQQEQPSLLIDPQNSTLKSRKKRQKLAQKTSQTNLIFIENTASQPFQDQNQ